MKRYKALILDILLITVLCILVWAGYSCKKEVSRWFTPISLRYTVPISGEKAYAARLYSVKNSDDGVFWPSFWQEGEATLSSEWSSVKTDCVFYSGDASLAWPGQYLYGCAPGSADSAGCALSEALAFKLFAQADVVGKALEIDSETYIVRGVFNGDMFLALLSYGIEDKSASFETIELSGGTGTALRDSAEAYAAASGLGNPDNLMMGEALESIAGILAALPIVITAVFAFFQLFKLLHKQSMLIYNTAVFLVFLFFALLLPRFVEALPAWFVPNRLSDLSHWTSLPASVSNNFRTFLAAARSKRDIEGLTIIIKQIVLSFTACLITIFVCMNRSTRTSENLDRVKKLRF